MITLDKVALESNGAFDNCDLSKFKFKEYNSYLDGIAARSILVDDFVASSETLFHSVFCPKLLKKIKIQVILFLKLVSMEIQ